MRQECPQRGVVDVARHETVGGHDELLAVFPRGTAVGTQEEEILLVGEAIEGLDIGAYVDPLVREGFLQITCEGLASTGQAVSKFGV